MEKDYFTLLMERLGDDNFFHTTDAWRVKSILENGISVSPDYASNTSDPMSCTLVKNLPSSAIDELISYAPWGTSRHNHLPLNVTFVIDGKFLLEKLKLRSYFETQGGWIHLRNYPNHKISPVAGILYVPQIQKSKSATLQEVVDADLLYGTFEIWPNSYVAYPKGKGIFTTQEELENKIREYIQNWHSTEQEAKERIFGDYNWFVERKKCIEKFLTGVNMSVNALYFAQSQFREHKIPLYTNRGETII
jgi:hypothetical protein